MALARASLQPVIQKITLEIWSLETMPEPIPIKDLPYLKSGTYHLPIR